MARKNYKTRAFLLAQHEADRARVADLTTQLRTARMTIQSLRDQLEVANRTAHPTGRRALMDEAKRLAKAGTPCYIRDGHIYNSKTREVLV